MGLDDFKKDVIRVMTKEEFESAINEDIKFVERIKHFFKHDDATRVMEHVLLLTTMMKPMISSQRLTKLQSLR
jgi:hypothetical protein